MLTVQKTCLFEASENCSPFSQGLLHLHPVLELVERMSHWDRLPPELQQYIRKYMFEICDLCNKYAIKFSPFRGIESYDICTACDKKLCTNCGAECSQHIQCWVCPIHQCSICKMATCQIVCCIVCNIGMCSRHYTNGCILCRYYTCPEHQLRLHTRTSRFVCVLCAETVSNWVKDGIQSHWGGSLPSS